MTLTSNAYLRIGADGRTRIDASVRLTGRSHIQCCTYPADAPILSVSDGAVSVSLTVPNREQVTAEDVDMARTLANEAARYVTELAELARRQQATNDAAGGEAA